MIEKSKKGKLLITLEKASGEVQNFEVHNYISPVAKMIDQCMSSEYFLRCGSTFGDKHAHQAFANFGPRYSTYAYPYVRVDSRTQLGIILSGSTVPENSNTTKLNNAIVGYATNDIYPPSDNKTGKVVHANPDLVRSPQISSRRWLFDAGVATGEIKSIMIAPISALKENGFGMSVWMCLDSIYAQDANSGQMSTQFCPPNIPGVTAENEILLNYVYVGSSKRRINLDTMMTQDISDPYFLFPKQAQDYFIEGDYIYVLGYDDSETTVTQKVYVYSLVSKTLITSFVGYVTNENSYRIKGAFLKIGDTWYITQSGLGIAYGTHEVAFPLQKNGTAYYNKIGSAIKSWDGLINVSSLPSSIVDLSTICIGHFGPYYALYVAIDSFGLTTAANQGRLSNVYLFTDLNNIQGTMKTDEAYFGVPLNGLPFYNTKYRGFLKVGSNLYVQTSQLQAWQSAFALGSTGGRVIVNNYNNFNESTIFSEPVTRGVWITMPNMNGNIYSCVNLQTPIVKGPQDRLWISYGYDYV